MITLDLATLSSSDTERTYHAWLAYDGLRDILEQGIASPFMHVWCDILLGDDVGKQAMVEVLLFMCASGSTDSERGPRTYRSILTTLLDRLEHSALSLHTSSGLLYKNTQDTFSYAAHAQELGVTHMKQLVPSLPLEHNCYRWDTSEEGHDPLERLFTIMRHKGWPFEREVLVKKTDSKTRPTVFTWSQARLLYLSKVRPERYIEQGMKAALPWRGPCHTTDTIWVESMIQIAWKWLTNSDVMERHDKDEARVLGKAWATLICTEGASIELCVEAWQKLKKRGEQRGTSKRTKVYLARYLAGFHQGVEEATLQLTLDQEPLSSVVRRPRV